LNRPGHGVTFQPMRPGRILRLLLLALPLVLGLAAGMDHPRPLPLEVVSTVSAPRESLPIPVHDEATCAFCQAAIFPPCAPHPTSVSIESCGLVRRERPLFDAVTPSFTSHRATSSRAPPPLRLV
jgi:hypothetical protein